MGVIKVRMISWPLGNQKHYKNLAWNISCKETGKARYEWEDFREDSMNDVSFIEVVHSKVSVVFCKHSDKLLVSVVTENFLIGWVIIECSIYHVAGFTMDKQPKFWQSVSYITWCSVPTVAKFGSVLQTQTWDLLWKGHTQERF